MADLSHLSDDELDAAIKAQAPKDLSHMSDADLDAAIQAQTPQQPPEAWGHWAIRKGLPLAGTIGGGIAGEGVGSIPLAAAGNVAGTEAASWLNHAIYGDEAPTYNSVNDAKRIAGEGVEGALTEVGGKVIGAVANPVVKSAGKWLGEAAETQAVKATGATGVQARQFAPGTGRALLDNGVVGFGRSQAEIADAADAVLGDQGNVIQKTIDELTNKGAGSNSADLAAGIQAKIDELAGDPAQSTVIKQLEAIKADVEAGKVAPSLAQTEETKRGFQGMVNYANPEGNVAKAAAADVYRQAGEASAQKVDGDLADKFLDAKKLYGQLKPVADASERRALQLQQSPTGGLGDMVAYGVGGVPGVVAKKLLYGRIDSSMASVADSLSTMLTKNPNAFGKWAPVLMTRMSTGGQTSLSAADYVLQQRDPEYRKLREQMNNQ